MVARNKQTESSKELEYEEVHPGIELNYHKDTLPCGCEVKTNINVKLDLQCSIIIQDLEYGKHAQLREHVITRDNWNPEDWSKVPVR